jgi:hypothetical protein
LRTDWGLAIYRLVAGILRSTVDEASGRWIWLQRKRLVDSISYRLERLGSGMAQLHLHYIVDGEAMAYTVPLVVERCRFGGLCYFALCSRLEARVAKLYLPPGCKRSLARKTDESPIARRMPARPLFAFASDVTGYSVSI